MSLVNRDCLETFAAGTRCGEWGTAGHDPTACPLCKASQKERLGLTGIQATEPCGEIQDSDCARGDC